MFHLPFIAMARKSVAIHGEVSAFVPIAYCIESAGTYICLCTFMMHIASKFTEYTIYALVFGHIL